VTVLRTLRFDMVVTAAERAALRARAEAEGVTIAFGPDAIFARTYARAHGDEAWHSFGDVSYDGAVIAFAIEPTPSDALPAIQAALHGRGRPAGVLTCDPVRGALIIEVRAESVLLALSIADVELQRFHGYRRTTLLTPLVAEDAATIAADGLVEPDLGPRRVLETLIGDAGL